jgi:hypothetical protein
VYTDFDLGPVSLGEPSNHRCLGPVKRQNICTKTGFGTQSRKLPVLQEIIGGCKRHGHLRGQDAYDNIWKFDEIGWTGDRYSRADFGFNSARQRGYNVAIMRSPGLNERPAHRGQLDARRRS